MVTLRITNYFKRSQTCEITVDKKTTISEVKDQVAEKFDIDDVRRIRLIIQGRELSDEATLDDYALYNEGTYDIHMILKLRIRNTYKNKYNNTMNNLVNKTRSIKNRLNRATNFRSKQKGGAILKNLTFVLLTGKKINLELDDSLTIEDTKRAVVDEFNGLGNMLTTESIRLQLYRGPLLETGTLKDNNVASESRIHVIQRMRGPNIRPAENNFSTTRKTAQGNSTPVEPIGPNFTPKRQTARELNK
jgi:hypothetical protein